MITLQFLQILWYALIVVLVAGFALLDGFDLGVGIILPFFASNEDEKKTMLGSIAPFWDGNEVWLVTAGGALFGSFPDAYATAFSGFYMVFIFTLFALIFRAVSFEFRTHDEKRKGLWELAFSTGSFFAVFFFGLILGNIMLGVPLDTNKEMQGGFLLYFRPFPVVVIFTGIVAVMMHGLSYIAMKTTGSLQERAFSAADRLWAILLAGIVIFIACVFVLLKANAGNIFLWLGIAIAAASAIGMKLSAMKKLEKMLFFTSSTAILGVFVIVGAAHFPNLVKSAGDSALSITIFNSSSPFDTLKLMSIVAIIGMPIVIAYTIFVYRVFKGKAGAGY